VAGAHAPVQKLYALGVIAAATAALAGNLAAQTAS
jgi:hypothetical protein